MNNIGFGLCAQEFRVRELNSRILLKLLFGVFLGIEFLQYHRDVASFSEPSYFLQMQDIAKFAFLISKVWSEFELMLFLVFFDRGENCC